MDQEFVAGNWRWRVGARYDRDNFSQEHLLSPRAAATWQASKDLRVTATLGRYYQAPRIEDRAADAANQRLENEAVDQLGVGFAYSLSNQLDLFVEPYYQDLSNRVVAEDRVNQTFSNSGDGRSYGEWIRRLRANSRMAGLRILNTPTTRPAFAITNKRPTPLPNTIGPTPPASAACGNQPALDTIGTLEMGIGQTQ